MMHHTEPLSLIIKEKRSKSMKQKKGDLSITIIIAAVIGLVTLVVLIAIFTNTTSNTSENIGSCATKGGLCENDYFHVDKPANECGGNYPVPIIVSGDCEGTTPNHLCCLKATN
jgi:flagellar basal body-associated protein FliL